MQRGQKPVGTPRLGAHMSIAGGHDRAVFAARAAGFTTVQVFTKSSNQWAAQPLTDARIRAFQEALQTTGVADPVAHNSYLINLASPDPALWERSIEAMLVELERAEALGIGDLVAHPGAHMGAGEDAGLKRVVRALNEIIRRTRGFQVRIDLESTAGQGSGLGHRLEHLAFILDRVSNPNRLGVCLDTCHLFAAGYALDEQDSYNAFVDQLARLVGVQRVRVWHFNDSQKPLGSRVDRHAGIGRGAMGLMPFRNILNDPRFAGMRIILETPKGVEDGEDLDVLNRRVLEQLMAQTHTHAGGRGPKGASKRHG